MKPPFAGVAFIFALLMPHFDARFMCETEVKQKLVGFVG